MKILLVEDDDRVRSALRDILQLHGIMVVPVGTARDAVARMGEDIDAVILDLGLPDQDGLAVLDRIRARRNIPVIISTARSDLQSRVHGLYRGADDYLVKPFEITELLARLHAVFRRTQRNAQPISPPEVPHTTSPGRSNSSRLKVNIQRHIVHVDERKVRLTRKEFELLAMLSRAPGVVYRREQLLSEIWHSVQKGTEHTLDVHIASLRAKLGAPELIETVRGVGYRLWTD